MKHGRGRGYVEQRYGASTADRIAKRLQGSKPFSAFIVDGDLRLADYLGARYHGLLADHGHAFVGTYIDMPTWSELVADIEATTAAVAKGQAASTGR